MWGWSKVGLALAIALVLAQEAPAQRGPGRGGFGGGPFGLLTNEGVQKELKLTEEQSEKIQKLAKESREKHTGEFEKLRDLDQSERQQKLQEMMKTINEEANKALAGVLKPEQEKRLKELRLQQEGAQAFADSEVQKGLKLTDEQKESIKTLGEDARKHMRELFQGGGGAGGANREELGKKMQALQKETLEKVMGVLTDDQKKAWKEMTGAPFEFHFQPRPRRGQGEAGR
jgi:Spy/CpxP family protein refolding chaperone